MANGNFASKGDIRHLVAIMVGPISLTDSPLRKQNGPDITVPRKPTGFWLAKKKTRKT